MALAAGRPSRYQPIVGSAAVCLTRPPTEILTRQSGLTGTIRSSEFTALINAVGTSAAAIRGILRKCFPNLRRQNVLVTAELTLVGRRVWNIAGTEDANPCYPFRMSTEPHDGQSSNGLNSVLAHRGGGGLQPRNCPVPCRCHWMAHPSSKGKRGSNYRQSRRKRGPPMRSARTGAVGTVIGAFVPLSPVVAFLIVIAVEGRARRYCASGLARRAG